MLFMNLIPGFKWTNLSAWSLEFTINYLYQGTDGLVLDDRPVVLRAGKVIHDPKRAQV